MPSPTDDLLTEPTPRAAVPMTQDFVDGYFAAKDAWARGQADNPYRRSTEAWHGFEEGLIDFRPPTPTRTE